ETIFYDPFEDRRINVVQSSQATSPGSRTDGTSSVSSPSTQAGSSSFNATTPSHSVPPYMTKESNIYSSSQAIDDRFPSTTPVQEFPEPPPAYTEIDRPPVQPPPPRTEVIVPETPNTTGLASPDRKLLLCQFCDQRVYTLAIKENGALTHVLAGFFIIAFAPLTLVVYCTDYFKYRNHYCPNCNRLVGYEVPIVCQDMVYSKAD
ncbi:jg24550, partial [Pararge aegeria aegeria]